MHIDFTNCTINRFRMYGGANGNKICINYKDKLYMLKFPPRASRNKNMSYSNGCFNEYIACHIYQSLGINTQNTLLGTYNNKVVVACEDFTGTGDNIIFSDFASLKNTIIDSERNGYGTELEDILATIDEQEIINPKVLKDFFWDMFITDAFLGNFDRHNGNWGFLIDKTQGNINIAPIFDCGSCLYPQLTDEDMDYILKHEGEINQRIYTFPNSAIKHNDVKISYVRFLASTSDINCLRALERINQKIDFEVIDDIVENTPFITDVFKKFVKTMLRERKKKILNVRNASVNTNFFTDN